MKFLPVMFICCQIGCLWLTYICLHCVPLLSQPESNKRAKIQMFSFIVASIMLVICYVRSILVHPGTIPSGRDEDGRTWEYVAPDARIVGGTSSAGSTEVALDLTETKRSGERRHCKWCAKYKPDRCHHCRVCRMCILKMDHHCPWIYNCVGFKNHKHFFLLLFYTCIATHIITWTMMESVKTSMGAETPFFTMFFLLFGQTLGSFLALLVTLFFSFHIWLMLKSMSTIEFCEKSMKRSAYDASSYDRGLLGNVKAVLGEDPLLWLLPVSTPVGDGLSYASSEDTPLCLSKDMESGRGHSKKSNDKQTKRSKKSAAGTGETGGSDASGHESESAREESGAQRDLVRPLNDSSKDPSKGLSPGLGGSS